VRTVDAENGAPGPSVGVPVRFRFAPSPTGDLHLGSAVSALLNAAFAKRDAGVFLVRIEDIDQGRCREEHVAGLNEDLAWLGLDWPRPALRQSQHFPRYRLALERLRLLGLVYPCFATRSEIAAAVADNPNHPRDPDGAPIYPGLCKGLSQHEVEDLAAAGDAMCWRLDMARALDFLDKAKPGKALCFTSWDGERGYETVTAQPERWGDFVVARKDTPTSYHLSVVIDDAYQGISHVVRGADLLAATDIHCLLQVLLGLPRPVYHHHGLVLGRDGRKLSKSEGGTSIRALRGRGLSALDVYALIRERLADQHTISILEKY
jgi:glutamyl-Q tRNA(Asp) synthetase